MELKEPAGLDGLPEPSSSLVQEVVNGKESHAEYQSGNATNMQENDGDEMLLTLTTLENLQSRVQGGMELGLPVQ